VFKVNITFIKHAENLSVQFHFTRFLFSLKVLECARLLPCWMLCWWQVKDLVHWLGSFLQPINYCRAQDYQERKYRFLSFRHDLIGNCTKPTSVKNGAWSTRRFIDETIYRYFQWLRVSRNESSCTKLALLTLLHECTEVNELIIFQLPSKSWFCCENERFYHVVFLIWTKL